MSSAYSKVLKKHPILVQAVQSGILMGTGDVIAQTFLEKTEIKNLNILRTAQFFGIGFFIGVNPCIHSSSNYEKSINFFVGPWITNVVRIPRQNKEWK